MSRHCFREAPRQLQSAAKQNTARPTARSIGPGAAHMTFTGRLPHWPYLGWEVGTRALQLEQSHQSSSSSSSESSESRSQSRPPGRGSSRACHCRRAPCTCRIAPSFGVSRAPVKPEHRSRSTKTLQVHTNLEAKVLSPCTQQAEATEEMQCEVKTGSHQDPRSAASCKGQLDPRLGLYPADEGHIRVLNIGVRSPVMPRRT